MFGRRRFKPTITPTVAKSSAPDQKKESAPASTSASSHVPFSSPSDVARSADNEGGSSGSPHSSPSKPARRLRGKAKPTPVASTVAAQSNTIPAPTSTSSSTVANAVTTTAGNGEEPRDLEPQIPVRPSEPLSTSEKTTPSPVVQTRPEPSLLPATSLPGADSALSCPQPKIKTTEPVATPTLPISSVTSASTPAQSTPTPNATPAEQAHSSLRPPLNVSDESPLEQPEPKRQPEQPAELSAFDEDDDALLASLKLSLSQEPTNTTTGSKASSLPNSQEENAALATIIEDDSLADLLPDPAVTLTLNDDDRKHRTAVASEIADFRPSYQPAFEESSLLHASARILADAQLVRSSPARRSQQLTVALIPPNDVATASDLDVVDLTHAKDATPKKQRPRASYGAAIPENLPDHIPQEKIEEEHRSKMTMAELIHWNPTVNKLEKEAGPDPNAKATAKETESPARSDGEASSNQAAAPQVTIGENGELIIDQGSLVVQQEQTVTETVEESTRRISSCSFRKRQPIKRGRTWTPKETDRFYKLLSATGTDFTLMAEFFSGRTREELKAKFGREERTSSSRLDAALKNKTELSADLYELSDEDEQNEESGAAKAEKPKTVKPATSRGPGRPPKRAKVTSQSERSNGQSGQEDDVDWTLMTPSGTRIEAYEDDDDYDERISQNIDATVERILKQTRSGRQPKKLIQYSLTSEPEAKPGAPLRPPPQKKTRLHEIPSTSSQHSDSANTSRSDSSMSDVNYEFVASQQVPPESSSGSVVVPLSNLTTFLTPQRTSTSRLVDISGAGSSSQSPSSSAFGPYQTPSGHRRSIINPANATAAAGISGLTPVSSSRSSGPVPASRTPSIASLLTNVQGGGQGRSQSILSQQLNSPSLMGGGGSGGSSLLAISTSQQRLSIPGQHHGSMSGQQQHHVSSPRQRHGSVSGQHHAPISGQHHVPISGQHHASIPGQHHGSISGQHHGSISGQHHVSAIPGQQHASTSSGPLHQFSTPPQQQQLLLTPGPAATSTPYYAQQPQFHPSSSTGAAAVGSHQQYSQPASQQHLAAAPSAHASAILGSLGIGQPATPIQLAPQPSTGNVVQTIPVPAMQGGGQIIVVHEKSTIPGQPDLIHLYMVSAPQATIALHPTALPQQQHNQVQLGVPQSLQLTPGQGLNNPNVQQQLTNPVASAISTLSLTRM